MHPNSACLPIPHILSSPLQQPPKENLKKNKQNKQISKQKQEQNKPNNNKKTTSVLPYLFICPRGIGSGVSRRIPFSPISFSSKCSLQRVTGLIQDLWFWFTIISGSSLELLWDILWLPLAMEILQCRSPGAVLS